MDTIASTVDEIRNQLADRTGQPAAGNRWSKRFIYKTLNNFRTKIVREKRLADQLMMHDFYTENICVPLVRAPLIDCPGIPPEGFMFLASAGPLPKPLRGKVESVITASGRDFTEVDFDDLAEKPGDRFAVFDDRHLYAWRTVNNKTSLMLRTSLHLKTVNVRMMLDDVTELYSCKTCNYKNLNCAYYPDLPFVIDADLKATVITMTTDYLLRSYINPASDIRGNDVDDTSSQAVIK